VLFCLAGVLLPAKGLAQDPERYRNGNKKQTQTNWATPAKPRTPRPPMFQAVFVIVGEVALMILEAFDLVLHKHPLLVDENLSPDGFDYTPKARRRLIHSSSVAPSVHSCRSLNEQRMIIVGRPRY
jgi:hypothetical protein